jgi:hypothetical protein
MAEGKVLTDEGTTTCAHDASRQNRLFTRINTLFYRHLAPDLAVWRSCPIANSSTKHTHTSLESFSLL